MIGILALGDVIQDVEQMVVDMEDRKKQHRHVHILSQRFPSRESPDPHDKI